MSKKARSARGDIVDFDLLTIKQQLADAPVPVGASHRRKFIDEKDGVKNRTVQIMEQTPNLKNLSPAETDLPLSSSLPSALSLGIESALASKNTFKKH